MQESLVGEWENPDAYLIFMADGSCVVTFGNWLQRGVWQVDDGKLTVQGDVPMVFPARIVKGSLWLDKIAFERVSPPPPQAAPPKKAKKAKKAAPPTTTRWVPEKLAGTWSSLSTGPVYRGSFQISRVLVLNSDGTYQFSSDSYNSGGFGQVSSATQEAGQWWVEGSLLWFAGEQGQSSRQLDLRNAKNGDPMIILDGHNYVTKFRRPSW